MHWDGQIDNTRQLRAGGFSTFCVSSWEGSFCDLDHDFKYIKLRATLIPTCLYLNPDAQIISIQHQLGVVIINFLPLIETLLTMYGNTRGSIIIQKQAGLRT